MDLRDAIAEQAVFSLHLASRIAPAPDYAPASNLDFSPRSLHVAFCLLATGSASETLQQLASFLRPFAGGGGGSSSSTELLNSLASQVVELVLADGMLLRGPRVSLASGVWVDQSLPLKPTFKQLAASTYKAEARAVDFQMKFCAAANYHGPAAISAYQIGYD